MQNLIALLICVLFASAGCRSNTDSATRSQASPQPAAAEATTSKTLSPSPVKQTPPTASPTNAKKPASTPNRKQITLLSQDQHAEVGFIVPTGWTVVQNGPTNAQLIPPKSLHKDYVRTQCQLKFGIRQCVDLCTTEHTLAGLDGSWENWSKQWVEPATRTGKPAKNAVKTTWNNVTDDKREGFRLVSGHLTYSDEAKKTAPYQDRIVTRCTQMNLGDTLSLDTECRGAFDYEKELRPGFESFCRSVTIKQHPAPKTKEEVLPSSKGAVQPVVPAEKPASTPSSKQ